MNKNKGLLGNLFKSDDGSEPGTSDAELMMLLYNLSSIGEGFGRKVDHEISQFKKMVTIDSPVNDLKEQVAVISNAIVESSILPEHKKLLDTFRNMPGEILLDEFINQDISNPVRSKLQHYRDTLQEGSLATTIIGDLITILDTTPEPADKGTGDSNDKHDIGNIISPLFRLCSQLELSEEQSNDLQELIGRTSKTNDIDQLGLVLEDVSTLILNSIATSTGQFELFLDRLKKRLDTVNSCVLSNNETSKAMMECAESFSKKISSQVDDAKTSFSKAESINKLEEVVSTSLEHILDGVSSFDQERNDIDKSATRAIIQLKDALQNARLETEQLKNNLQQQKLRELTDPLTKLPNRQAYNERLNLEYNRFKRYRTPLSLIMGDIDLFKKINDTHGHIVGDTALKKTASILQNNIRATDFVARFGGEEFVIIMPETNIVEATKAVNKIRLSVQQNQIVEESVTLNLTMSFGVASFAKENTTKMVLEQADKALYRAKSRGRNLVCAQQI